MLPSKKKLDKKFKDIFTDLILENGTMLELAKIGDDRKWNLICSHNNFIKKHKEKQKNAHLIYKLIKRLKENSKILHLIKLRSYLQNFASEMDFKSFKILKGC